MKRSRSHLKVVTPADSPATDPQDAMLGLRAYCQWCDASLPATLISLPSPAITQNTGFDLHRLIQEKGEKAVLTHTIRAWCEFCKVYGFDQPLNLNKEPVTLKSAVYELYQQMRLEIRQAYGLIN